MRLRRACFHVGGFGLNKGREGFSPKSTLYPAQGGDSSASQLHELSVGIKGGRAATPGQALPSRVKGFSPQVLSKFY